MSSSKIVFIFIIYAIYLLQNISSNSLERDRTAPASPQKMIICGARLPDMVKLACKTLGLKVYTLHDKRSPFYSGFGRYRRDATLREKCCNVGCYPETFLQYCEAQNKSTTTTTPAPVPSTANVVPFKILRAFLEFFNTRQLSSNGYENFPVRTQTSSARIPEISSPDRFAQDAPEVAAQTNEQPVQFRTQGRMPIPKANIIRDDDDDSSIFSTGF